MSIEDRTVAGEESTLADFFRLLELEARNAATFPAAMSRLRQGELQGVLVHGVLSESQRSEVITNLENHTPPFITTRFPDAFRSWFYGCNLNLTPPDLGSYFIEADRFNNQLSELTSSTPTIVDAITQTLSQLDSGTPYVAPPGPAAEQRYMFTTIRAHEPGGFIPQHFDNEQALRPSYQHLMSIIEPRLVSFVLSLAESEAGGELEVFNQSQAASATALSNDDAASPISTNPATLRSVRFRIPPGSMIVVDSGRLLHSVTPVQGTQRRWVTCSFMARSLNHDSVYCWG